ncbi:MAG: valine--tRNA ligase [Pirellula sp.]|jgi:valyl-tRNA synthetase|nr:valine--tRNA ligase [Pirellula sp.]
MTNAEIQEIPNRFDFSTACAEIYEAWTTNGCFDANVAPSKKPFTIVIPPPNVTGALHLGHALNNTMQDVQIRMHRMMGFEALWIPGTDHAGIATQAVVEKRLKEIENKTRHDLGREKLVQRIWEWKDQYEARILGQLKSMGCSCDWRRTRFTLDERCAKAVRSTFYDLFAKGLIFRGKRLVNWDTFLQTAVSDDEVYAATTKGHFWHLQYPILDPKSGEPTHVTIATTRPETMLGDTAVAVHPRPTEALAKYEQGLREKITEANAKDLPALNAQLEELVSRRRDHLPLLELLANMARDGRKIMLPIVNREIPLVADVWAKPEMGSGCVKITPAHDPNDYEVAKRCDLPLLNIMNSDGTLNENGGPYVGMSMARARDKVVAQMDDLGLLLKVEDREIELKHSDRSKTPIEPYLADQWFVKMDQLAQSAMDAVTDGRVKIYPPRYANGYLDWLGEKRDWPVGRQLWWGHQIPIWSRTLEDASKAHSMKFQIESMPERAAGLLVAHIEEPATVHVCVQEEDRGLEVKLESLGLTRQEDVLDTWFSSALWPHSTLGWPDLNEDLSYFYPTTTLITSRDIITLWVARMVLMGLNNLGEVPFREVFIHPKILDGYGETMSKSKGNGVDPIDVIDKFGPDALRFGLAWLCTETQDVRMPVQYECPHCEAKVNQTKENRQTPTVKCDKCQKLFSTQWAESEQDKAHPKASVVSERFEQARNFVNKLWNASRFVMMNLEDFTFEKLSTKDLPLEDQWILSRLASVTEQLETELKQYHYAEGARAIYDFAWDHFCSLYVEMAKPRLQNPAMRPQVQRVLAHVLDRMLRLLHPIMPFVTEAIWTQLNKITRQRDFITGEAAGDWIVRAPWPVVDKKFINPNVAKQFSHFVDLIGAVREIRSRQNIAPKDKVAFSVRCNDEMKQLLSPMAPFIESMANATATQWNSNPTMPAIPAQISIPEMDVFVDLTQFIDVAAEIARNEKLEANLVKQIQGKEGRLANESFVSRAPADIIEKERQALSELVTQLAEVKEAINKLRTL